MAGADSRDGARNLALIGYRATGKTHVGEALAQRLGWPLVDTDQQIQQRAGCTIREIFEAGGEAAFREWESQVLADGLSAHDQAVFALGGGAILRAENREALHRRAACVWLRAQPEEIWKRLEGDTATRDQRPALTDLNGFNEIVAVLSEREPIYRQSADYHVDTDHKTVGEIVDEILSLKSWDH